MEIGSFLTDANFVQNSIAVNVVVVDADVVAVVVVAVAVVWTLRWDDTANDWNKKSNTERNFSNPYSLARALGRTFT